MHVPVTPLEQRALFLAYHRAEFGPMGGIFENEVEALHRVPLINAGLLARLEHKAHPKASRQGMTRLLVVTYKGKLVKNRLLDQDRGYPYITSLAAVPVHVATTLDRHKQVVKVDCANLNDALEWINHERLSRGYPTMSIGWLRHLVEQPRRNLKAVKSGRRWMIPIGELEKHKTDLIKPSTHYSKRSTQPKKSLDKS